MTLFSKIRDWLAPSAGLVAAGLLILVAAGPASAQSFRVPPDAKGYQTYQLQQAYQQQQVRAKVAAHASAPVARSSVWVVIPPLEVIVSAPVVKDNSIYVDLRGPDGQVRRFPVEGGPSSIVVRDMVVRPGQPVTLYLPSPHGAR